MEKNNHKKYIIDSKHKLNPISDSDHQLHIVYVSDDSYTDYLGVAIHSVITHSDSDRLYDIIVLTTDMDDNHTSEIISMADGYENVSIRIVDISAVISGMDLLVSNNYNISTYYRLFLTDIFEDVDRLLYLDADTIVCDNLIELYDTDFDGKYIIGTYDTQIACWQNYNSGMRSYFHSIGLGESGTYVQAGVLLFDIASIRKHINMKQIIEAARKERYAFNDQDLINIFFKGKIKIVGLEWNVINNNNEGTADCEVHLSNNQKKEWHQAMKAPRIIHFTQRSFPCNVLHGKYESIYWEMAQGTVFFSRLMVIKNKNYLDEPKQIKKIDIIKSPKKKPNTVKEILKRSRLLVKIVRWIKSQKPHYSILELKAINVTGSNDRANNYITLHPGARINCLHSLWNTGYHAVIITATINDKGQNIQAKLLCSYGHEVLDKAIIHSEKTKLCCNIDEARVDVELDIMNTSKEDVTIKKIRLKHKSL